MAIKTKEELFGDGSPGNPAVPVDTNPPAGYGVDNRAVVDGENLVDSVLNRTTYALAINDEDLDSRIAVFEAGGLDGAYNVGGLINKDAGAVTIQSALAALYDDDGANALLRVDAVGDTAGGAVGVDAQSKAGTVGGGNVAAFAAFLDRRRKTFTGNTVLDASEAITLNPTGALAAQVRVSASGHQFFTGTDTELWLGIDLIEISGSAANDGLYIIVGKGATNDDAVLQTLNGTTPSFATPDEAATATFWRPMMGSFGNFTARTKLSQAIITGDDETDTALRVNAGGARGLSIQSRDDGGDAVEQFEVFSDGATYQRVTSLNATTVSPHPSLTLPLGAAHYQSRGNLIPGFVSEVLASEKAAPGFISVLGADWDSIGIPGISPSLSVTFVAGSPTGVLSFSGTAQDAENFVRTIPLGMVGHVTVNSDTTKNAWVRIVDKDEAGKTITVETIAGFDPSGFPTSGNGSLDVFNTSYLGGATRGLDVNSLDANYDTTRPVNLMTAMAVNDTALVLSASGDATAWGAGYRALLRGWEGDENGTLGTKETVLLTSKGDLHLAGDFLYGSTPPTRTRKVPLTHGFTDDPSKWSFNPLLYQWAFTYTASDGNVYFDLLHLIPTGATLTAVRSSIDPDDVNVVSPHKARVYVDGVEVDSADAADTGTTPQVITNTLSEAISSATESVVLRVTGNAYDMLLTKVELDFEDPGPRNY